MPAGIVLAGGRSSRMGTPKAWLDWHGTTLLRRTCGVVATRHRRPDRGRARAGSGASRAADVLSASSRTRAKDAGRCRDSSRGWRRSRTEIAFVAATDMPFLHPRFVAAVCAAAGDGVDAAVPHIDGFRQPLAAAYRTALAPTVADMIDEGLDEARHAVRALRDSLAQRPPASGERAQPQRDRRLRGGPRRARAQRARALLRTAASSPRRRARGHARRRGRRGGGRCSTCTWWRRSTATRSHATRRSRSPRATTWRSWPRTREAEAHQGYSGVHAPRRLLRQGARRRPRRWRQCRPAAGRRAAPRHPRRRRARHAPDLRARAARGRAARPGGAARVRVLPAGRHAADDEREVRGRGEVAADRPPERRAGVEPLRDRGQADGQRRDRRPRRLRRAVGADRRRRRRPPRRRRGPVGPAGRRGRDAAARAAGAGVSRGRDRTGGRAPGPLRDDLARRPPRRPRRARRGARAPSG